MDVDDLKKAYSALKLAGSVDLKSGTVADLVADTAQRSAAFLSEVSRSSLRSLVPNKSYFAFEVDNKISRAVNERLYNIESLDDLDYLTGDKLSELSGSRRSELLYTIVMSFFATNDLLKSRDQKGPGTYFEIVAGHLLARAFDQNPRTQVEVLHLEDERGTLPTDFIFDLGAKKPKFHVPVKTSTRERAIQVFAHQRVLDGVHGSGSFAGILVCFAETKTDQNKREVVEICLPKQWQLYYRHIAQLRRFYYFDPPAKYAALAQGIPPIPVAEFTNFFDESDDLANFVF